MSEALAVREVQIMGEMLPVPKGCTVRQVALAKRMLTFDPEKDTLKQCLLDAGFALETAMNQTSRVTGAEGVRRATDALMSRQADSSRGLISMGHELIASAKRDDIAERDKIALGLMAVKQGHEIGENTEQTGEAGAWKLRQRRAIRLAFHVAVATAKHNIWGFRLKQPIP